MKKPLKRIIISLSSIFIILFVTTKTSESCGLYCMPEDYRVAFFSASVLGDDVFKPFYYTSEIINGGSSSFDNDKERNLKLWQRELGSSVQLSDIDKVLYLADSDEVINAYEEEKLNNFFAGNTFVTALLKPKNKAILEYLITTKKNEFINFAGKNPWGFYDEGTSENQYNETRERRHIIDKIDKRLATASTDFLKQRYAYLQLVNCRYYGKPQKGEAIFNQYFDINNNDIITAWAIFHTASFLQNETKANYYLSLAFDKCDSKKLRCYFGFREKLTNQTLSFAKNNIEKATIYALANINNPAKKLEIIREIYSLDANNQNLQALIRREISKIEDWLLTSKVTGMPKSIEQEGNDFFGSGDYSYINGKWVDIAPQQPQLYRNEIGWQSNYFFIKNYEKDLAYAREFRNFLEEIVPSKSNNKDFLNLVISHLYFMDDKPQQALAYNNKVSNSKLENSIQKEINNVLLLPLLENINTKSTKNKLYKSLQFIQNNLNNINKPLRTVSQLHLYLSKMYFRKGDKVTAAFFHQKSRFTAKQEWEGSIYYSSIAFFDRYGTTTEIEKAIQLLDKKNPTDFEKYILTKYTANEKAYEKGMAEYSYTFGTWNMKEVNLIDIEKGKINLKKALIDLQGTIAFRQDKLEDALAYFKKLPSDYWETTYRFAVFLNKTPFEKDFIWDMDNEENEIKANKAKIVEDLIALKTKADKTNDANLYMTLGNAYHNFTYDGNNWMMFSYGNYGTELDKNAKTGYASYSFYPNANTYFNVYYGCDRAREHYQTAFDIANSPSKKDKEVSAKAALMITLCENKKEYAENKISGGDKQTDWSVSEDWKNTYKDTDIYREIAMSCSFEEED